jgi:hypothetical protein
VTYRQLRERGFKGTKYDAELMIAQGFTLAATTHQHTVAPFLGTSNQFLTVFWIFTRISYRVNATIIFVSNLNRILFTILCRQHRRCTATAAAAAGDTPGSGSTAAPLQDRPPQKRPGRKRREI